MIDWHARIEKERTELDGKIERLTAFMESPDFEVLSPRHRDLLRWQRLVMREYSAILTSRNAYNKKLKDDV